MKKRPDAKLGRSSHKRFFTLKGDTLYWGKDPKHAFEKSVALEKYLMIERGAEAGNNAEGIKEDEKPPLDRRRSSVMTISKKGKMVMRMVPRDQKKDDSLELYSSDAAGDEKIEDISKWVSTINTRISLIRYLEGVDQQGLSRGGREIIGFICDPSQSEIRIENKVADLHTILTHFKEPLSHRKGVNFILTNCAVSNADVDILCDIIESNDTVQVVNLQQNLITANGATRLATALKKNKSVTELRLDFNSLKDEGVIALAEAVSCHRNLSVLGLAGNNISDPGCVAIMTALMEGQKKHGDAHCLPILELSNNLIGDPGAKAIARMIRKNTSVEHLLLNSNLLSDKGLGYIFDVAIKHQLPIKSLHVADNQISTKSAESLTRLLAATPHEMTVDLSLNKLISRKGIATILSADVPMEFKQFFIIKKDKSAESQSAAVESRVSNVDAEPSQSEVEVVV
jgi:hypothetical protein